MITEIDGEPVHNISDLATIFEQAGVGKTVDLTVDAETAPSRTVKITVGTYPS